MTSLKGQDLVPVIRSVQAQLEQLGRMDLARSIEEVLNMKDFAVGGDLIEMTIEVLREVESSLGRGVPRTLRRDITLLQRELRHRVSNLPSL